MKGMKSIRAAVLLLVLFRGGVGLGQDADATPWGRVPAKPMAVFSVRDGQAFWRGYASSGLGVMLRELHAVFATNQPAWSGGCLPLELLSTNTFAQCSRWTWYAPFSAPADSASLPWQLEAYGVPPEDRTDRFVWAVSSNRFVVGPVGVSLATEPWKSGFLDARVLSYVLPDADFLFWFDARAVLGSGYFDSSPGWRSAVAQTGIDSVKGLLVSGVFGETGTRIRANLIATGQFTGLWEALIPLDRPSVLSPTVPRTALEALRGRFNFAHLLACLLKAAKGQGYLESDLFVASKGNPGISVRKSLLPYVGTDLVYFRESPKSKNWAALSETPVALALESNDSEALLSSVGALLISWYGADVSVVSEQWTEHTLMTVDALNDRVRLPIGGRRLVFWAAAGVLYGAGSQQTIMSLQTPEGENALVGSSVLADHYRALGGPVGFSYYQNHRAYARLFWSLLRFLPGSAVGMEFPGWKLSLPAGVAWGELPDFDRLARAFGYGVVNMRGDSKAITLDYLAPGAPKSGAGAGSAPSK